MPTFVGQERLRLPGGMQVVESISKPGRRSTLCAAPLSPPSPETVVDEIKCTHPCTSIRNFNLCINVLRNCSPTLFPGSLGALHACVARVVTGSEFIPLFVSMPRTLDSFLDHGQGRAFTATPLRSVFPRHDRVLSRRAPGKNARDRAMQWRCIDGARLVPVVGNLLLLGAPRRLRFGWWHGGRRAGTGKEDLLPTRLLPQRAAISRPSTEPESHAKNHNVSSSPSKQQQDEQECLPETVKSKSGIGGVQVQVGLDRVRGYPCTSFDLFASQTDLFTTVTIRTRSLVP